MQPDFIAELAAYVPADEREAEEKDVILDYARRFPDTVLTRENRIAHITSSAFVVNAAGDKMLMAHHIQRGVWAWPGGHADGNADLLAVALREAEEETVTLREIEILEVGTQEEQMYGVLEELERQRMTLLPPQDGEQS